MKNNPFEKVLDPLTNTMTRFGAKGKRPCGEMRQADEDFPETPLKRKT